jgi:adenosylmethionine-8-amino-7-oxononanoate aminotransferase
MTDLRTEAGEHLWLHFTQMHDYAAPVIVRGEGCYLWDDTGKRYLDALAGLFAVNVGYSYGEEIGQAALAQMRELPYYTNWSYAHPRAIELATELARLAPGDVNRAFFVSGGSEAVEAAWKLAREYHAARGERRWKVIARRTAYHGSTMGALSITGVGSVRTPFEPLVPGVTHVHNTNRYHRPPDETEAEFTAFLLDDLESAIEQEGPSSVAMVIMEPVQNSGGCFVPPAGYFQGVREICDRHGILLCCDEVINAFGRVGAWFASEKYDIRPDLITCAKGLSSAYAAIGALLVSDKVHAAFRSDEAIYRHGMTFGGHPVGCAIALKNLEIIQRDGIIERVVTYQDEFRARLASLLDRPLVGDLRGTGYFYALELVKNKGTRAGFDAEEQERLLRGFLSPTFFENGLICRSDDRGDPVVQISPPLVAGPEEFEIIVDVLGNALEAAGSLIG